MEYYLGNTKINQFWLGNTQINNFINEFYRPPGEPLLYMNPNYAPVSSSVTNFGSGGDGEYQGNVTYVSTDIPRFDIDRSVDQGRIVFGDFGDPLENVTMAYWIKHADNTGAHIFKWNDVGAQRSVGGRRITVDTMNYYASKDGSAIDWMYAAPNVPFSNTWWYCTYRYDGSTGGFEFTFANSGSYDEFTGLAAWNFGGSGSIYDNAEPWTLGAELFGTGYINGLSGSMGHVFIYNDYLSDTDVETIYNETKGHYYP